MAFSTPDTLVSGDTVTLARYNKLKDSIIADAFAVIPLGGSDTIAIPTGGGAKDAVNYLEFQVPTSDYTGHTYKVVVEVWSENATTTVTPRLYNVTDATAAWTGSASTQTARGSSAEQVSSAVTIAAGKRYRLQFTKNNDTYDGFGIGHLRRTHA